MKTIEIFTGGRIAWIREEDARAAHFESNIALLEKQRRSFDIALMNAHRSLDLLRHVGGEITLAEAMSRTIESE